MKVFGHDLVDKDVQCAQLYDDLKHQLLTKFESVSSLELRASTKTLTIQEKTYNSISDKNKNSLKTIMVIWATAKTFADGVNNRSNGKSHSTYSKMGLEENFFFKTLLFRQIVCVSDKACHELSTPDMPRNGNIPGAYVSFITEMQRVIR